MFIANFQKIKKKNLHLKSSRSAGISLLENVFERKADEGNEEAMVQWEQRPKSLKHLQLRFPPKGHQEYSHCQSRVRFASSLLQQGRMLEGEHAKIWECLGKGVGRVLLGFGLGLDDLERSKGLFQIEFCYEAGASQ